jgi:hypothetical protein
MIMMMMITIAIVITTTTTTIIIWGRKLFLSTNFVYIKSVKHL